MVHFAVKTIVLAQKLYILAFFQGDPEKIGSLARVSLYCYDPLTNRKGYPPSTIYNL